MSGGPCRIVTTAATASSTVSRARWLGLAAAGAGLLLLSSKRKRDKPRGPEPAIPAIPLDDYADYEPPGECDPAAKPGTQAFRLLVLRQFGGGDLGITRVCDDTPDEHEEGRAWDWGIVPGATMPGTPYQPADVAGFLAWLLGPDAEGRLHAIARRAGVMYVIYDRQMWRAYDAPGRPRGRWYPYTGPDPHDTHIHVSFSRAGAAGLTSLYSGMALSELR